MGKADAILFLMSDRRRGIRRERNRHKFCIMSDEARRKDGTVFCIMSSEEGVCSTDLRLYTSTNGLKQVYTSPEAIY